MHEVNLSGVDLNLLPALEALLRRGSVTLAADDVGLSQPAMSRAVGRLRAVLGDPLLMRGQSGFVLTPFAEALRPRVAQATEAARALFRPIAFEPAKARRTIRIAGTDVHGVLLVPEMMRRVRVQAPGLDVRIEPYSAGMAQRMERGELDFAFAVANLPLPNGANSASIATDTLSLIMRRGHPAARNKWRLDDYATWEHVGVSILGDGQSDIDAELAQAGISRRIGLVTPHFVSALAAVGQSDMVTTLSTTLARRFKDTFGLTLVRPPITQSILEMTLVWSHVRATDPLLMWFRQIVQEAAQVVFHEARGQGAKKR